jgi:hypothetical protein
MKRSNLKLNYQANNAPFSNVGHIIEGTERNISVIMQRLRNFVGVSYLHELSDLREFIVFQFLLLLRA